MHIRVESFQSLADVALEAEGLTVLTGPSDRGKSALVRAISAALFGLPGEYFIRTGAPSARVRLDFGEGHTVVWEKGSGKNQFLVDGELFSKVGTKVPEALQALGFRDELIGARIKDDGSVEGGKWVRPQVAGQFDSIFLLEESGTFLNEVIVKLSRLGVLQRAERQCALDLRSTKSLLTTRQRDLDAATVAAEALAEAPRLRARLTALLAMEQERQAAQARALQLRTLLTARTHAQARLQHALPPALPERAEAVREMRETHAGLAAARPLVAKRERLLRLPTDLPAHIAPDSPEATMCAGALARLHHLGRLIGARTMRVLNVDAAHAQVVQAGLRYDERQQALRAFVAALPLCPVCARPWDEDRVHGVAV